MKMDTKFKKGNIPWNKGKKGKYHLSEQTKEKQSIAHKGQIAWNKGKKGHTNSGSFKKGIIPWMKGKHPSKETIEKQRASLIKTYSTNPELRKRVSDATKRVMSNPEFRKRLGKIRKEGIVSGKIKTWNKGKKTGLVPWTKGKKFPETAERSRKTILRMYESGNFPRQENTKIERQIKAELLKRGYKEGIDFIHQYRFMNKFMCDFCFPQQKIIVEAYGDFWHCNPKKYPVPIHPHQLKDIGRDKSKEAYITKADNNSWTYLVLWERDIQKDVSKCVDKIEEVLREKK